MFEFLKDENAFLMTALSGERSEIPLCAELLERTDMKCFFELCKEHELSGVVASKIIKEGLSPLPDYWMRDYESEKKRLSLFKKEAEEVCRVLYENGIKAVILKNGGIMADIIEDEAACPMEDIDSLVRKSDFKSAHEILLKLGFTFRYRSDYESEDIEKALSNGSAEYCKVLEGGEKLWFELSHRAIDGRWIRRDREPSTDILIKNAHFAENTNTGILDSEDNLLQVCVHTAKHSYVRAPGLRLHLDVDRIVCHRDIDWEVFLEKVRDTGVKTAVYFSLLIPKNIFGTPVPEFVLNDLRPKPGKEKRIMRILKRAGLLHPGEKKFTKMGYIVFQTSLYDKPCDALRVLYPGGEAMRGIYGYKSPLLTPYYIVLRGLDLAGIRRKKDRKKTKGDL